MRLQHVFLYRLDFWTRLRVLWIVTVWQLTLTVSCTKYVQNARNTHSNPFNLSRLGRVDQGGHAEHALARKFGPCQIYNHANPGALNHFEPKDQTLIKQSMWNACHGAAGATSWQLMIRSRKKRGVSLTFFSLTGVCLLTPFAMDRSASKKASTGSPSAVVISLEQGSYQATVRDNVARFLGIPYAASTAGEGRCLQTKEKGGRTALKTNKNINIFASKDNVQYHQMNLVNHKQKEFTGTWSTQQKPQDDNRGREILIVQLLFICLWRSTKTFLLHKLRFFLLRGFPLQTSHDFLWHHSVRDKISITRLHPAFTRHHSNNEHQQWHPALKQVQNRLRDLSQALSVCSSKVDECHHLAD